MFPRLVAVRSIKERLVSGTVVRVRWDAVQLCLHRKQLLHTRDNASPAAAHPILKSFFTCLKQEKKDRNMMSWSQGQGERHGHMICDMICK